MADFRKQRDPVWSGDLDAGDIISLSQARVINQRRLADFGLTLYPCSKNRVAVRRLTATEKRIDGGYYKSLSR
jgi:hypothetical protein